MARRVAPRRRCAPGTFACGRSIRLAATTRPGDDARGAARGDGAGRGGSVCI
jgi:hypothetical protein